MKILRLRRGREGMIRVSDKNKEINIKDFNRDPNVLSVGGGILEFVCMESVSTAVRKDISVRTVRTHNSTKDYDSPQRQ